MQKKSTKLFLFDIDGTLMSSNLAGSRSFLRSCREVLGLVGEVDGVLMAGKLDRVIFQEIAETFRPELTERELADYWPRFKKGYIEYLRAESKDPEGWTLMPGVKKLLEHCSSLGKMALLTGNVREGASIKLKTLGVAGYFPTGGFGEDLISRNRLAELAFKQAREYFGIDFSSIFTYVIGDTVRDVEAGLSIGARTIAVATGTVSFAELQDAGADLTVGNFDTGAEEIKEFLGE
ncbi:HAD family hydrolase [Gemmatimonadota bacterium]